MKSKTKIHRQKVSLNLTVIIVKPVMIESAVTKEKIGGLTVQENPKLMCQKCYKKYLKEKEQ